MLPATVGCGTSATLLAGAMCRGEIWVPPRGMCVDILYMFVYLFIYMYVHILYRYDIHRICPCSIFFHGWRSQFLSISHLLHCLLCVLMNISPGMVRNSQPDADCDCLEVPLKPMKVNERVFR